MTRGDTPFWRRYLRFWGPDPRADMEEEFAFHIVERTEELIVRGMDPREARREALRGFGDLERVKSTCLDLAVERQDAMRKQETLAVLGQDVLFALRQMRAQSLLTFAALLTLAVGIGATTSIFSVVNAVLLQPLPYRDSDRVVILWETLREFDQGRASPGHFRDWTEQSTTLDGTAAWLVQNYNLTGDGEPERLVGARVTSGWFDVLHMPPALGRYFLPGEDESGARVVVLSHDLWQNRFGGDRAILGRAIELGGEPFTVIGVTPAAFTLSEFDERLWTPLRIPPQEVGNYGSHGLLVVGKLKPGVTRDQAQADIARVTDGIRVRAPREMEGRGVNVERFTDTLIGNYRMQLMVLLGAVVFVLLIACGNVASLLLARATTRRKELAIRASLGGSRARLVRQLLTESLVLAGMGGAIGVLLAIFGTRALTASAPLGVPRLSDAGLSANVLLFAVGATVVCGLLFGLAPALRATRTDLQSTLREGGKTSRSAARDWLRSAVVIGEIAVALVLVVGAGLFIRSLQNVQRVPLGFDPAGVSMARLVWPAEKYSGPAVLIPTYGRLLEELRAQPGIASAAIATRAPLWGPTTDIGLTLRNFPRPASETQAAHVRLVSNGYFETLDIPLRKGRLLQASDLQPGAPYVVVMNATLARQSFGDVDPIGQYVTGWNGDGETIWREVVGVVGDVRAFGREREAPAELFFPYSQAPSGSWTAFQRNGITLLARAGVGGEAVSSMRAAVRTVDAAIPLFDVRNMNEVITLTTAGRRFNMLLLSLLGITGVLLAAVGIYGVVAFFVLQRTHEIGVRMALGATTRDVVRLVMGHSARLTVLGLTTGALGAIAVTRVLTSLLFEIEARDPLTFVAGAGVLATVALAAALLPAHRATRVHPVQSLAVGQ